MNKNGFTVVELLVSFALSMVVMVFLFQTVIALKDLYVQNGLKTEMLSKQGLLSKRINDDIISSGIYKIEECDKESNCYEITLNSGVVKKLSINKAKRTVTYETYVAEFPEKTNIGDIVIKNKNNDITFGVLSDNDIISILIPITNSMLINTNQKVQLDYGIRCVYQKISS